MEYLASLSDDYFSRGMTLEDYLKQAKNYRSFVRGLIDKVSLDEAQVSALKAAAEGHPGPLRATVNTEDWCGDWACNAAFLDAFFSASGVEMRIFRGSENPELKERYERDGDSHIPAISLWDAEGKELSRWIEAPKAVGAKKDAWKAENPRFMDTYRRQNSDTEAKKAFPRMYRDFMDMMAEWYADGMWAETAREIIESLEAGR